MPRECMVTKMALKVHVFGVALFVLGVGEAYRFRTLLIGLSYFSLYCLKKRCF